jgi:hypothetical protein
MASECHLQYRQRGKHEHAQDKARSQPPHIDAAAACAPMHAVGFEADALAVRVALPRNLQGSNIWICAALVNKSGRSAA